MWCHRPGPKYLPTSLRAVIVNTNITGKCFSEVYTPEKKLGNN